MRFEQRHDSLAGRRSKEELLAIRGVGAKAIRVLGEALAARGLDYKTP
ncbi:MAG: hypothetical protein KF850_35700 [Labilithrix sp.]|nr:hypothetical protein [Labilithrix sp.]